MKKSKENKNAIQNESFSMTGIASYFGNVLRNAITGEPITRNSLGSRRDFYNTLGYPRGLSFNDYAKVYCRQDIAKRAIDALPNASWNDDIKIISEDNEKLEEEMDAFSSKIRLYQNMNRADKLSALGRYSILYIGIDSDEDIHLPPMVRSLDNILYLTPFTEADVSIGAMEADPKSIRYGLPLYYKINFGGKNTKEVHYSRVIHIAYDKLDSDLYGTPRLQSIYNRLIDLEKLVGGNAEMFWLNGRAGMHINISPEAFKNDATGEKRRALKREFDDYNDNLSRIISTSHIEVKPLEVSISDPSNAINATLDLIASALSIPKRILLGSERGELSSSQDERNFCDTICAHRENHCEANMLRPFIDRLMLWGVIPKTDYNIKWTALGEPTQKEKTENALRLSQAISQYANSPFASSIIPPSQFIEEVLGVEDKRDQVDDLIEQEGSAIDRDNNG